MKPIIKWAGGKSRLLPSILPFVPKQIRIYQEPFAGGAALFWDLLEKKIFKTARLGDLNECLIGFYRTVRDQPQKLIDDLLGLPIDLDTFIEVRKRYPTDDLERAVKIAYLNRTGFNGIWRENKKGVCNTPWGKPPPNRKLIDSKLVHQASSLLKEMDVGLSSGSFEQCLGLDPLGPEDFVYLDPPYWPTSKTSSFTAYTSKTFGQFDQHFLYKKCVELTEKKVPWLLSNSDVPEVRDLYKDFHITTVTSPRFINSNGKRRGPVPELLIRPF